MVVVIGGAHSNNTQELVRTCSHYCGQVFHVQTAEDLREQWFEGAQTVGVTAGTSTPDSAIEEIERWLNQLAAGSIHQRAVHDPVEMQHRQAA